IVGSPSRIRLALAVVPPMSKEITLAKPSARPVCAEAMIPPTGPDSIIATGRSVATSGVITPPFECTIFAQYFVGKRDVGIGQGPADDFACRALVLRVGVGVQEADGDRFNLFFREPPAGAFDASALQGLQDIARGEHALADFPRQLTWDERAVPVEEKIVGFGAVAASDGVHVARPSRDDQAGLRAFALDQGVDGGGRAVDQLADLPGIYAAHAQAIDDPLDELGGRGEALGLGEPAGGLVKGHQVRESPADIDRNQQQVRPPRNAQTVSWSDEQSRRQAPLSLVPGKRAVPALSRRGMGRAGPRRRSPLRIPDPGRRPGGPFLVHYPREA